MHRGMQIEVPHPVAGRMPMIANPMRFSGAELAHVAPPTLGQHNREVLQGLLGLDDDELADLAARQVV
jgi:crotonobetainyl-CoA:carnitine CoA-transferase CaiB-like acyl-CoA transferase